MPITVSPMFTSSLGGSDAALIPRTPDLAEAYHELLVANRERLDRWDPGACPDPLTLDGTRAKLQRDAEALVAGTAIPVAIAVSRDHGWRLVGGASLRLKPYDTAEVGYWIDAAFEGRGLVRRSVAALLDHAFNVRGLERVVLNTDAANHRSRALAQRLKFTEEGLLRRAIPAADGRHDEVIYGILAEEWPLTGVKRG